MSDNLQFSNEKDSSEAVDLNQKEQDIQGAIDAQKESSLQTIAEGGTPEFASADETDVAVEAMTMKSSTMAAVATSTLAELNGGTESTFFPGASSGGKKGATQSTFLGEVAGTRKGHLQNTNVKSSFMPPGSYFERVGAEKAVKKAVGKAMKKGGIVRNTGKGGNPAHHDIMENVNVVGMSVGGVSSTSSGRSVGLKGANISNDAAVTMGLLDPNLVKSLNNVKKAQRGEMEMSSARMEDDLKKGNFDKVNNFVKNNQSAPVVQNMMNGSGM